MQDPYTQNSSMPVVDGKTDVMALDYKTAGILCYLPICAINLIASLVFLNSEPKQNMFLRFHAMQSLVMIVAYIAAAIAVTIVSGILGFIPVIGWLLAIVLHLGLLCCSILFIWKSVQGMIAASRGEIVEFPYVGEIAKQRL